MQNKAKCVCLIPFHNEGNRFLYTLSQLQKVPSIDQFLLVNDGSTDSIATNVKQLFPGMRVVRLSKNHGKTEAVAKGLKMIHSPYIFLADADLRNIRPEEFDRGIKLFKKHSWAMLFFRRIKDASHVYTGERIIKTALLRKILEQKKQIHGYQLEAAINQYCLDHSLDTYWVAITAQNTYKVLKMGPAGWLSDLKTIKDIISYVGIKNYFRQIFMFAKEF